MSDLVHGRYGVADPIWRLLGGQVNASQSDIAVRSNLYGLSLNGLEAGAAVTTKEGTYVAVPVQEGDSISKVSILQAAVGSSITNQFAAVYSGLVGTNKPVLLAQSVAGGTTELAEYSLVTYTLQTSILINSLTAPNGYVYAGVNLEATTPGTQLMVKIKPKAQFNWFPGSPTCFATTTKQKSATEAATNLEIKAQVGLESVPLVFLW